MKYKKVADRRQNLTRNVTKKSKMFQPLFQKFVKLSSHFSAISIENKIKVKLSRKFSNSLTVTMAADMSLGSSPLIAMEIASRKMRTIRNF